MRRLDVEDMVELDMLSEIDRLSSIVSEEHIKPATDIRKAAQDHKPKKLTAALTKKTSGFLHGSLTGP